MKPRILLVEDNKELLEVIAEELHELYDVLKATDGVHALKLLSTESVQLVISDVMMPVMDGFELCKEIKSSFEFSHIPVILLTAKNTLQAKIEGLSLGADAYIEKPFETEYLQAHVASLLNNRKKLRDYFVNTPFAHLKTSVAHNKSDELFFEKLNHLIQTNIEDHSLDVDKLAKLMNMGRTSLFRKIKSVTDLTPNELINITRLKKAAELLSGGEYKIYEVSDMVGFGSQTNFGRIFLKQFGMTPTEYQKNKHAKAGGDEKTK
jgi:two-component system cell cycle response regulator